MNKLRVLLITSYCGDDSAECSDDFPCSDCLDMCNVAEIEYPKNITVLGGLDYLKRIEQGD